MAGVAWFVNGLLGLGAVDGSTGFYVTEVVWLGVHALVLAGILGLRASDATGDERWGRTALGAAAVARVLFFAFEIAAIVRGTDELAVFPIAVVGTGVSMVVAGVAVIRASRWKGWRRFAPLAVGAYPFVAIVPVFAATGSRPPDALVAGWGLALVAVGLAFPRSAPADSTLEGRPAPDAAALLH